MKGAALPADWRPSTDDIVYGLGLGFVKDAIFEMAEDMRLWAGANANRAVARKADWGLTFKGWMRREAKRHQKKHASSSPMSYMDIAQGLRDGNGQRAYTATEQSSEPDFFAGSEHQPRRQRHH